MSENNQDNKVVPFPTHKVKKPAAGGNGTIVQSLDRNRKVTLFLSLFSTLLLATLLTSRLNQQTVRHDSRSLASEGGEFERRSLDEEIVMAKKIARESLREPASRGREPTAEDILRHSELASVYHLYFNEKTSALVGLDFFGKEGKEERTLDAKKRAQFLKDHKDLMRIDFDESYVKETIAGKQADKDRIFEVYELKKDGKIKARVHFTLDDQDHLYSMKVELI